MYGRIRKWIKRQRFQLARPPRKRDQPDWYRFHVQVLVPDSLLKYFDCRRVWVNPLTKLMICRDVRYVIGEDGTGQAKSIRLRSVRVPSDLVIVREGERRGS